MGGKKDEGLDEAPHYHGIATACARLPTTNFWNSCSFARYRDAA
jgi:hypothetical protein